MTRCRRQTAPKTKIFRFMAKPFTDEDMMAAVGGLLEDEEAGGSAAAG